MKSPKQVLKILDFQDGGQEVQTFLVGNHSVNKTLDFFFIKLYLFFHYFT